MNNDFIQEQITDEKKLVGERAAEYIKDGMIVGLGTGSTVYFTILKLGQMVKAGLKIKAVSTSVQTTVLAGELGIPLCELNDVPYVDLTIDGADEVDSTFSGIKGGGGALLFEKLVASYSKKNIWVVDSSKYVDRLGRFPLPIEVIPLVSQHVIRRLAENNIYSELRKKEEVIYCTDSGNVIIDLQMGAVEEYDKFNDWLLSIPGVIQTGLFLGIADEVIMVKDGSVGVLYKNNRER